MTIKTLNDTDGVIFCGVDVGKHHHLLVALDALGKKIISKKFSQEEHEIRDLLTKAQKFGIPVVVVDQPRSIGSLLVSVCQNMEISIYYISSLAMRRYADMHPGNAKTDARDAYMIAKAAQEYP